MKTKCTAFCNHVYYSINKQPFSLSHSELCYPYSCSASDFSIAARIEATTQILSTLPNSFPGLFREVMRLQGVTIRELCNRIPISEHTISVLRTKPRTAYALNQVVAISIGLQLPPFLSRQLLHKAGFHLDGNPHASLYLYIIDTMFMLTYDNVLEFLQATTFSPQLLI